jgi:hypothetical protein
MRPRAYLAAQAPSLTSPASGEGAAYNSLCEISVPSP